MNKQLLFGLIVVISTIIIGACEKKNEGEKTSDDIVVVDVSGESEWDYFVASIKDNGNILIDVNNTSVEKVFYTPSIEHQGYPIFLSKNGLPEKAIINGIIFLFSNFRDNLFDIAVIDESNNIEIIRDVESSYNFDDITKSASLSSGWRDIIKIATIATSVAACGIGVATAFTGVGLAIAAVGCTATAVLIATELMPEDQEILGLSANTVGTFATVVGCVDSFGIPCVLGVLSTGLTVTDAYIEMNDQKEDVVNDAHNMLTSIPIRVGSFGITGGTYEIDEDWTSAVISEFGSGFRPLDWNELKAYFNSGGDLLELYDDLGLTDYGNAGAILWNGEQRHSSSRGYFASRHEHNKPSNYLAHDNIDNYLISLGSWEGKRKILVIKK